MAPVATGEIGLRMKGQMSRSHRQKHAQWVLWRLAGMINAGPGYDLAGMLSLKTLSCLTAVLRQFFSLGLGLSLVGRCLGLGYGLDSCCLGLRLRLGAIESEALGQSVSLLLH